MKKYIRYMHIGFTWEVSLRFDSIDVIAVVTCTRFIRVHSG